MPRRIPSYRLHRPSGQAVVTLDGRDHYLGLYGTEASRRKYDQLIAAWLLGQPMPGPAPGGASVAEIVARYTAPTPVAALACRLLAARCGMERAADFTPGALNRWRNWLRDEVPRDGGRRGYAPSTCNKLLGCVKELFRWAATEDLVPGPVWHGLLAVESLPTTPRRVGPVSAELLTATLQGCHAVLRAALGVQHLAAMRPGEVLGLTPADVNREGRLPNGHSFAGVWCYVVADEFNKLAHRGIPRYVFLGPRAQTLLRPFLEGRSADRAAFCPAEVPLSTTGGESYSTMSFHRALRNVTGRLALPAWHPNQLRHLRATEIRTLYGPEAARVVLGHQLPGNTGVYAEPGLELAAKVMRQIG